MKTENLAVAFVDIVGFTPRTSSQSREENERMLQRFGDVVRPVVGAFGGRVAKSIGDAFLVTFRSPTDALHWGMAVHDKLAESNAAVSEGERFDIRVAVNVGEVRVEAGDVFGEAVNIAARIEGEAGPGEVYFSEAVCLVMTRSEVPYEEVGVRELKGIKDPVKLYRIPRVSEVGNYRMQGSGTPEAAAPASALAPPALPFGGVALEKAKARMARDPVKLVTGAFAPAVDSIRTSWNARLLAFGGIATVTIVLALVVAFAAGVLPRKQKPKTPWERFKESVQRER